MPEFEGLKKPFQPNWQGMVDNILRKGTPDRCYNIELFHDGPLEDAVIKMFDLEKGLDKNDPDFPRWLHIKFLRFLGFDYAYSGPGGQNWQFRGKSVDDTVTGEQSRGQRGYMDESRGPITTWEEFDKYDWPDPHAGDLTADLEWLQGNLPDDMAIFCHEIGHYCEYLTWLMGYETLCISLYDQRDLVEAIRQKLLEYYRVVLPRVAELDRIKVFFPSDDMGFRGGTFLAPDDMRHFFLTGHKELAKVAHETHRPCILHACGNLHSIIDDLIDDVQIDGKHSYEDTIEDVREVKQGYGQRIALLGGIDVDFLCRSDAQAIRKRVRETLDVCMPGGGYCLGTGNTPANYIPVENYLAMVDEGRLYGR